ncbi:hypothetical protein D3C81_1701660 [compost metagenome]
MISNLQTLGSQDIALLTIHIVDQGDVSGTVRIILDCSNFAGYVIFVPFEVDNPVLLFVTAALVANRDLTLVITACLFGQGSKQRFLRFRRRDFLESGYGHGAACRRRWLIRFDRHLDFPPCLQDCLYTDSKNSSSLLSGVS